jgi:hypothetical protein
MNFFNIERGQSGEIESYAWHMAA